MSDDNGIFLEPVKGNAFLLNMEDLTIFASIIMKCGLTCQINGTPVERLLFNPDELEKIVRRTLDAVHKSREITQKEKPLL